MHMLSYDKNIPQLAPADFIATKTNDVKICFSCTVGARVRFQPAAHVLPDHRPPFPRARLHVLLPARGFHRPTPGGRAREGGGG